jgi:RHS repeat-associated protein
MGADVPLRINVIPVTDVYLRDPSCWWFRVVAVDESGNESAPSVARRDEHLSPLCGEVATLSPPTNVRATTANCPGDPLCPSNYWGSPCATKIEWDPVPNATRYYLYRYNLVHGFYFYRTHEGTATAYVERGDSDSFDVDRYEWACPYHDPYSETECRTGTLEAYYVTAAGDSGAESPPSQVVLWDCASPDPYSRLERPASPSSADYFAAQEHPAPDDADLVCRANGHAATGHVQGSAFLTPSGAVLPAAASRTSSDAGGTSQSVAVTASLLKLGSLADPPWTVMHLHTDHLGSVRVVTNMFGEVISTHDYFPFGQEIAPMVDYNTHLFTGHERDAETGLDYMMARYYNQGTARFISSDPLGGYWDRPSTLNRYAYAANNPLKYVDPNGLDFYLVDNKGNKVKGGDACKEEGRCDKDGNLIVKSSEVEDSDRGYSATVNENGVKITGDKTAAVQGTFAAEFIENTPGADVAGSGAFEGFNFKIEGSCGGRCLASRTFSVRGGTDATRDLLDARGAYRSVADKRIPLLGRSVDEMVFHPDATQHRFGSGPSPHFSVPDAGCGERCSGHSLRTTGPFHVDKDSAGLAHILCATSGIGCQY